MINNVNNDKNNNKNKITCSLSLDKDFYEKFKSICYREGLSVKKCLIDYMKFTIENDKVNNSEVDNSYNDDHYTKINESIFIPYGNDPILDHRVDSNNWFDRMNAADYCYGLNKLINDECWEVRRKVAEKGYGLDKLINDENYYVRVEVVKHKYRLDKLVNDESWIVRANVANQNYGLDKLVNDENWWVRLAVANQGYGLNELVYDSRAEVANAAYSWLEENDMSLEQWMKKYPDKVVKIK